MLKLRAGTNLKKTISGGDYPASDSWTGKLHIVGTTAYEITATADGDDYLVNADGTVTAGYSSGYYSWAFIVTKGNDTHVLQEGIIEISAAVTVTGDQRSHVKKMLDSIEATLEGRAASDVLEYEIEGRKLKKTPVHELIRLRSHYRHLYKQELAANKIARGESVSSDIRVRF